MKPLKLEMSAFGPYAGVEILDFQPHIDARLFGVYGPTGSGKSTIFSAISYALFDTSAKEKETGEMMISDHADPKIQSYTRFIFDLGDKRYHVFRSPAQKCKSLKSDKLTKQGAIANFYDASGLHVNDISDKNPGTVIAEKKKTQVNDEIEKVLGYNAKVFHQIVLLPQGKFETFLKAKTKDRASSLKALFDVSLYQKITETLVQESKEIIKEIERQRIEMRGKLKGYGVESKEELDKKIEHVQSNDRTKTKQHKSAEEDHTKTLKRFDEGRGTLQKFEELKKAIADVDRLVTQVPEFDDKRHRLKQARRFSPLTDIQKRITEIAEKAVDANQKETEAKTAHTTAQQNRKKQENVLTGMKDDLDSLPHHRTLHDRLRGGRKAVERLETCNQELDAAIADKTEVEEKIKDSGFRITTAGKTVDDAYNAISNHHVADKQRVQAVQCLQEEERKFTLVNQKVAAKKKLQEATTAVTEAIKDLCAAEKVIPGFETAFALAEAALKGAQAYHLAASLKDRESCPVCGSIEHPSPASHSLEGQDLDKKFRSAKTNLKNAEGKKNTADKVLGIAREKELSQKNIFEGIQAPDLSLDAALENKTEADKALKELPAVKPLDDLKIEHETAKKEMETLKTKKHQLDAGRQKHDAAETKARATIEEIRKSLVNGIDTVTELDDQIDQIQGKINQIETAESNAKRAIKELKDAEDEAKNDLTKAETTHRNLIDNHTKEKTDFDEKLKKLKLTKEEFEAQNLDDATQTTLDTEIREFQRKKDKADGWKDRAEAAVKGVKQPDLECLRTEETRAKTVVDDLQKELGSVQEELKGLTTCRENIVKEEKDLVDSENKTAPLRSLASAFNGSNNDNMNLETYALGVMFARVIEAANHRFNPMSGRRYRFVHTSEGMQKKGKLGLDIMIDDINTGKTRPTATLSGGEMFMASLSLALGLSDVVESMNGNVRLDTIFIDEGFGSLDDDNGSGTLDEVITTLTNLASNGRAVGIISHVRHVQERIPHGFYVKKTNQGSSVESR